MLTVRLTTTIVVSAASVMLVGCTAPQVRARLLRENEALREETGSLKRQLAQREARIASLEEQVGSLQGFAADRPVGVFSPVELEIASRSGGANYDDQPGDDGVTVHLRLKDADGDSVKVSGKIQVQVLDMSTAKSPTVLAVCTLEKTEELREAWFGRFGTDHYTIKCPFTENAVRPQTPRVTVRVTFTDYLTGRTLSAAEEFEITPAGST